ncbi:MAG: GxxExxY protein [Bacteroidetes bacterium]|nr:GxxExxY protein [Bacteroidota bacterium]
MKQENILSYQIRKAIFEVNKILGPGLNESIYEEALYYELLNMNLKVERQVVFPVFYKGIHLQKKFIIDMLIDNCVIIETKSVDNINETHKSQLLNYLKISGIQLGILVNFNTNFITDKKDIFRIINSNASSYKKRIS